MASLPAFHAITKEAYALESQYLYTIQITNFDVWSLDKDKQHLNALIANKLHNIRRSIPCRERWQAPPLSHTTEACKGNLSHLQKVQQLANIFLGKVDGG